MPEVTPFSVPPTSASAPTLKLPAHHLATSKAVLTTLAGTETIMWHDRIGGRLHVATIGAHSATSLTINSAAAPGGQVTYSLTGDGSTDVPVVVADP